MVLVAMTGDLIANLTVIPQCGSHRLVIDIDNKLDGCVYNAGQEGIKTRTEPYRSPDTPNL